jgi:hypothetical protein
MNGTGLVRANSRAECAGAGSTATGVHRCNPCISKVRHIREFRKMTGASAPANLPGPRYSSILKREYSFERASLWLSMYRP